MKRWRKKEHIGDKSKVSHLTPRYLPPSPLLSKPFFFFPFFGHSAWLVGSYFPKQGSNPALSVKAPSPNHWTAREFLPNHLEQSGPIPLSNWFFTLMCLVREMYFLNNLKKIIIILVIGALGRNIEKIEKSYN